MCLGKALAQLEIRLMAKGLLQQVKLELAGDQDLTLQLIPSPTPETAFWFRRQLGDEAGVPEDGSRG